MNSAHHLSILALLAFPSLAAADTLTGRVVSSTGASVAGVNIDAFRVSNGNEEDNLLHDGTSATGDFVTTIPAGVYDLVFFPPAPPATSHVALVVRNVVVAGTRDLGTLTLPAGSVVSGRVQTQASLPLPNVTIQVIDELTGFEVPLAIDKTSAFGNFDVAVPRNAIELRIDASGLATPVVVSQSLALIPTTNTNLGNVTLAPGFRVTGHVQRAANGLAVSGVDLDLTSRATGDKVFTPDDNTGALGNFSIVVAEGRYDIEFCPVFAQRLVATAVPKRLISADTDLGVIALEPGFVLTGTIRSFSGQVQANADVDVVFHDTRAPVPTCGDNSDAAGVYAVIVPAANLRVSFHPPGFDENLGSDQIGSVLVSADTVLDGTLPFCASPQNYGTGLAGTGGFVPHLSSSGGVPTNGNANFAYELSGGRGGAFAALIVSLEPRSLPVLGGTLLVGASSATSVRLTTTLGGTPGIGGAGSARVMLPLSLNTLGGLDLYAQFAVRDPLAPQGWALSDGLAFRVCR